MGYGLHFFIILVSLVHIFDHCYNFNKLLYDMDHHKHFSTLGWKPHLVSHPPAQKAHKTTFFSQTPSYLWNIKLTPSYDHMWSLTDYSTAVLMLLVHLCLSPLWNGWRLCTTAHTTAGIRLPQSDHTLVLEGPLHAWGISLHNRSCKQSMKHTTVSRSDKQSRN